MKILIAQTGLHHITRGAEIAFTSVAAELNKLGKDQVTLCGMGRPIAGAPYEFRRVRGLTRDRFGRAPKFPPLREDTTWEDLMFSLGLRFVATPKHFDVTMTSDFPFTQMALRARLPWTQRVPNVYVTHSGDWAAHANNAEFRFFTCDGLICINPDYYERNKDRWFSRMIPNGVDVDLFRPGVGDRERFGIPTDRPVVLIVAALIESKRVMEAVTAASQIPDVAVVVAGAGALRSEVLALGEERLGDRFRLLSVQRSDMGELYRCADVFVHLSKIEPGALVYSEALASGLPIVAHDTSVTRWLVGRHASLLDTDDEAAVVAAIEHELRSDSPARREERVTDARQRYSWDVVAAETHDFLAEVVARRESK